MKIKNTLIDWFQSTLIKKKQKDKLICIRNYFYFYNILPGMIFFKDKVYRTERNYLPMKFS
jgi:hypothetical protein